MFVNNWFEGPSSNLPISAPSVDEALEQRQRRLRSLYVWEETTFDDLASSSSQTSRTRPLPMMLTPLSTTQGIIPPDLRWIVPWPLRPPPLASQQNQFQSIRPSDEDSINDSHGTTADFVGDEPNNCDQTR